MPTAHDGDGDDWEMAAENWEKGADNADPERSVPSCVTPETVPSKSEPDPQSEQEPASKPVAKKSNKKMTAKEKKALKEAEKATKAAERKAAAAQPEKKKPPPADGEAGDEDEWGTVTLEKRVIKAPEKPKGKGPPKVAPALFAPFALTSGSFDSYSVPGVARRQKLC